jgi:hypothetical protein
MAVSVADATMRLTVARGDSTKFARVANCAHEPKQFLGLGVPQSGSTKNIGD